MIVVNASALVAIRDDLLAEALSRAARATITPINHVEAGLILVGRQRFSDQAAYQYWLRILDIETASLDLADEALAAYLAFGKGWHPARLNLADCFAYALAKTLDAPLLYKGEDFAKTDVRSALQPT